MKTWCQTILHQIENGKTILLETKRWDIVLIILLMGGALAMVCLPLPNGPFHGDHGKFASPDSMEAATPMMPHQKMDVLLFGLFGKHGICAINRDSNQVITPRLSITDAYDLEVENLVIYIFKLSYSMILNDTTHPNMKLWIRTVKGSPLHYALADAQGWEDIVSDFKKRFLGSTVSEQLKNYARHCRVGTRAETKVMSDTMVVSLQVSDSLVRSNWVWEMSRYIRQYVQLFVVPPAQADKYRILVSHLYAPGVGCHVTTDILHPAFRGQVETSVTILPQKVKPCKCSQHCP